MVDVVLDSFATDETLGLVFADDPHLPDWDANVAAALQLTARMGIAGPLPPFFNFPVGGMFWARPEALKPLLARKLAWHDYPQEPIANEGTILHALERLLPLVVQHAGDRYAATHIPGVIWDGAKGTIHDMESHRSLI